MKIKNIINKSRKLLNYDFDEIKENEIEIKRINNEINEKIKELDLKIDKINATLNSQFAYNSLEFLPLCNYTNKKKVLICGFYGAFNLGDELMLQTILNYLNKKNNLDITIMLCDNPNTDITKYGKYNFIHYPKTKTDLNTIASYYDCLIFGGGAIIDDKDYDKNDIQMTLGYILINLTLRFLTLEKTTILYGLSANDKISNREFIEKLKFIINNCNYISLRDTNSLDVLKNLELQTSKIKIVDDIVFANDYKIINKTNKDKVKNIGVIYINFEEEKEKLILNTKKLIEYLDSKNILYNINFIPFYDYCNIDKNFYYELKNQFNTSNINIIDLRFDLNSLTECFNNQDYIISMRYHGSLIANIMNKKVLTLMYNHRHYKNKISYMYEKYKFYENIAYEITDENLDNLFNSKKVNNNIDKYLEQAKKDLEEALMLVENKESAN